MITQTKPATAEELLHQPSDGYRYELVKGELKKMAPAGNEHGSIAAVFTGLLIVLRPRSEARQSLRRRNRLQNRHRPRHRPRARRRVHQPEASGRGGDPSGGYWPGAPDLVAEVVSPGDLYTEVGEKVAEWLGAGSRMVVVVNPRNKQVLVHSSPTDVKVLGLGDTLEGWRGGAGLAAFC